MRVERMASSRVEYNEYYVIPLYIKWLYLLVGLLDALSALYVESKKLQSFPKQTFVGI